MKKRSKGLDKVVVGRRRQQISWPGHVGSCVGVQLGAPDTRREVQVARCWRVWRCFTARLLAAAVGLMLNILWTEV